MPHYGLQLLGLFVIMNILGSFYIVKFRLLLFGLFSLCPLYSLILFCENSVSYHCVSLYIFLSYCCHEGTWNFEFQCGKLHQPPCVGLVVN